MRETVPWPRATHRATHAFFVLSVNFPRASWSRHIRTLTHEPIVKLKAILGRKQTQAEGTKVTKSLFKKKELGLFPVHWSESESSLMILLFLGFDSRALGFLFWISWWMLNVKEQPLLHQSCRCKYPRRQSKWLVTIYGYFILSPRWRGSNAFSPICSTAEN